MLHFCFNESLYSYVYFKTRSCLISIILNFVDTAKGFSMKNGSNVIIEIWLTTDISNAYVSHSLFVTLYQLSYKAVCLKICSLSYFPLFVLHCVAGHMIIKEMF
jgi:hypothetical protein